MHDQRGSDVPLPAELAVRDGLAYARFEPDGPPRGGVVVLHGADSCKESHFDFARECRAAGLSAVAFDQRGHGDSEGALGPGVLEDIVTMAGLLGPGPLFLRGSSMGGLLALISAERVGARAVVAICPAEGDGMVRGLQSGRVEFRAEMPGAADFFAVSDPEAAAVALGPDLMLMHADGDERVSVEVSVHLSRMARGSTFVRVPGGHHRSIQHDGEMQARSIAFLLERT